MGDHEKPEIVEAALPDVVEAKVWASTAAAGGVGGAIAVLNAIADNAGLIDGLPKAWQSVVLVVVPLLLTFAAGWAKTSNRV